MRTLSMRCGARVLAACVVVSMGVPLDRGQSMVGHEHGGRLVADMEDADSGVDAGVVQRRVRVAAEAAALRHALPCQGSDNQFGAKHVTLVSGGSRPPYRGG